MAISDSDPAASVAVEKALAEVASTSATATDSAVEPAHQDHCDAPPQDGSNTVITSLTTQRETLTQMLGEREQQLSDAFTANQHLAEAISERDALISEMATQVRQLEIAVSGLPPAEASACADAPPSPAQLDRTAEELTQRLRQAAEGIGRLQDEKEALQNKLDDARSDWMVKRLSAQRRLQEEKERMGKELKAAEQRLEEVKASCAAELRAAEAGQKALAKTMENSVAMFKDRDESITLASSRDISIPDAVEEGKGGTESQTGTLSSPTLENSRDFDVSELTDAPHAARGEEERYKHVQAAAVRTARQAPKVRPSSAPSVRRISVASNLAAFRHEISANGVPLVRYCKAPSSRELSPAARARGGQPPLTDNGTTPAAACRQSGRSSSPCQSRMSQRTRPQSPARFVLVRPPCFAAGVEGPPGAASRPSPFSITSPVGMMSPAAIGRSPTWSNAGQPRSVSCTSWRTQAAPVSCHPPRDPSPVPWPRGVALVNGAGTPSAPAAGQARGPSAQPAAATSPSMVHPRFVEATFSPGRLDILCQGKEVISVMDGQAKRAGVQVGWKLAAVDGVPYSNTGLASKTAGASPFVVKFETPPYTHVDSPACPDNMTPHPRNAEFGSVTPRASCLQPVSSALGHNVPVVATRVAVLRSVDARHSPPHPVSSIKVPVNMFQPRVFPFYCEQ